MAITASIPTDAYNHPMKWVAGDREVHVVDVVLGAYATGGLAISKDDCLFRDVLLHIEDGFARKTDATDGVFVSYNPSTGKLVCYQSTTGAPNKLVEVANATSLAAYTVRLTTYGK